MNYGGLVLREIQTIVVGVEAFLESREHYRSILRALNWFQKDGVKIHFVSVMNPDDLGWPQDLDDAEWVNQVKDEAAKEISAKVRTFAPQSNFEITVLLQRALSKTKTVSMFLDYARQNNANLLLVHSHTKSGLLSSIGSFCEKLINRSSIPVLILPFQGKVAPALDAILYPTDFSGLSKTVFQDIAQWSGKNHAKLIIYHRIARPIDAIFQVVLHPVESRTVLPSDFVMINENELRKEANEWITLASSVSCTADYQMDSAKFTLREAILFQAENQKVDLIAMPTHTSFREIPSLGSAVSHVIRTASIPVLVNPVPYKSPGSFPK